jgi:iron complex transport system substrate-binding protein
VRIVCLSAEAADICYRLGLWEQVAAVSAFAEVHDSSKPVVSGFSTTNLDRVVSLHPDLTIAFSDVQAEAVAGLVRRGQRVLALNQRSLAEIAETIGFLGRALDRPTEGLELARWFEIQLASLRFNPVRAPRVYFEEWDDPMISSIGWVSEIIALVGGKEVFAHRLAPRAQSRVVTVEEVVSANPEIIFASWCGKRVDLGAFANRPGFAEIDAVKHQQIFAIEASDILQPGPAVLRGAAEIGSIVRAWCQRQKEH